jgi:hypothetical protein
MGGQATPINVLGVVVPLSKRLKSPPQGVPEVVRPPITV